MKSYIKKNKTCDLLLKFIVEFIDSERLSKYNDVLQKVLKKDNQTHEDHKTILNISSLGV